jgi:hypothetical protein
MGKRVQRRLVEQSGHRERARGVTTSDITHNATSYIYNSAGLQTVLMPNEGYIVIYLGENNALALYSETAVEVRTSARLHDPTCLTPSLGKVERVGKLLG